METRAHLLGALRSLVGRKLAAVDSRVLRQAFVVEPAGLGVLSALKDSRDAQCAYSARCVAYELSSYAEGRRTRGEQLRHAVELLSQLPCGQCIVGCFPRRLSLLGRALFFPDGRIAAFGRSDIDAMMLQSGVHAYHISPLGPVYLLLAWK
jgi:hypothetical protein